MELLNQYRIPLGFLLISVWLLFGDAISTIVGKLWAKVPVPAWPKTNAATAPVVDLEYAEVQALKLLDKRFERLKCKEGKEALAVVKKEFFTDHSAEG
jgi:hypothetical protein